MSEFEYFVETFRCLLLLFWGIGRRRTGSSSQFQLELNCETCEFEFVCHAELSWNVIEHWKNAKVLKFNWTPLIQNFNNRVWKCGKLFSLSNAMRSAASENWPEDFSDDFSFESKLKFLLIFHAEESWWRWNVRQRNRRMSFMMIFGSQRIYAMLADIELENKFLWFCCNKSRVLMLSRFDWILPFKIL